MSLVDMAHSVDAKTCARGGWTPLAYRLHTYT